MLVSLILSVPSLDSRFTSTCTSDSSDLMYTCIHSSSSILVPLYTNTYTHHYNSDRPHTIINSSQFISLFVESYQLILIHLDSSLYPGQHPHNSSLDSEHAINSLPPRRTHIDSTYVAAHHIVSSLTL